MSLYLSCKKYIIDCQTPVAAGGGVRNLFDIENHEGWVKYTTGEFNEYKTARNKREALFKHKFPGPFVTAYNNGERITVQEALMTSKQDWVQ